MDKKTGREKMVVPGDGVREGIRYSQVHTIIVVRAQRTGHLGAPEKLRVLVYTPLLRYACQHQWSSWNGRQSFRIV